MGLRRGRHFWGAEVRLTSDFAYNVHAIYATRKSFLAVL